MDKRVYLEGRLPILSLHSLYQSLIEFPPEGYKIITSEYASHKNKSKKIDIIHKFDKVIIREKNHYIKTFFDAFIPMIYYGTLKLYPFKKPNSYDLIYSSQHIINKKMPWVVDLEHAGALFAYGNIRYYKNIIEKYLMSDYCKKIMPWSEAGKITCLNVFRNNNIKQKIETVNLAVPLKNEVKKIKKNFIQLLFVGTSNKWNIEDSFNIKGGKEVLMSFINLNKYYKNIKLVVRSSVPDEIKYKYRHNKDIFIIDNIIPKKELDLLYANSDIFLFPGHQTPGMVILEAMSFGLPIITTDIWGNREMVKNGINGFLIPKNNKIKYFDKYNIPLGGTNYILNKIKHIDHNYLKELHEKIALLIEDNSLRKKMSRNSLNVTKYGKFSLANRNKKLKKIFDQAS